MRKQILIYGDSNVYGETSYNEGRVPYDKRWSTLLQTQLGEDVLVVAEGFSGRTAGDLETDEDTKQANGHVYFPTIYCSHAPVDLLIIALGTNDAKLEYKQSTTDIMDNLLWYRDEVRRIADNDKRFDVPSVLYVLPPQADNSDPEFFEADNGVLRELSELMSGENVVKPGVIDQVADGVHFSEEGHEQMAKVVYDKVKEIL